MGMKARARDRATIFGEAPTLYDRFRPGYPDEAVDALVRLAALSAGDRVLEIGAGTGHLTIALLTRGVRVTALEPEPRMAALLERRLSGHSGATVRLTRFEDARVQAGSFDAVMAATAFHWVDRERRYALAARALRLGGHLGLIRNDHALSASSEPYYRGVEDLYRQLAPEMGPPYLPPTERTITRLAPDVEASGLFDEVKERRFARDRVHTSKTLIGLLRTYSEHRALPVVRRRALLQAVRRFVDDQLGGQFVDRYVTTICVARKANLSPG